MSIARKLNILTINYAIPESSLQQLRLLFSTVHYYPKDDIPKDIMAQSQVHYGKSLPLSVEDLSDVPNLIHHQLPMAGAEKPLAHSAIVKALSRGQSIPFTLSNASGLHTISIPQYILTVVLALFHRLQQQILYAKVEKRWGTGDDIAAGTTKFFPTSANETSFFCRSLRGKTVGLLGYGHLARETARLVQAFGANVIAANTDGKRRVDIGFHFPGTGDSEGVIPREYFSTSDNEAMQIFFKQTDVLVCSLPSTPETKGFLTAQKLALLPAYAIFVNVGRGDLVSSADLLQALDAKEGLSGIAIDVTDPEPLPTGHPLWSHPRAIVTCHLSGEAEGELETGVDILQWNVERLLRGEPLGNQVQWHRGY